MTENEAIKTFKEPTKHITKRLLDEEETICYSSDMVKAFEMAIQAIDKVQQFEAIGTIEEFKEMKSGDFTEHLLNMGYTKGYNKGIDECIKIIEETTWKDTDMLVESIRELKRGGVE